MLRFFCILLAFILMNVILPLGRELLAESPRWRSIHITNEQGLSNSAVNTIFRDHRGFMWFGTWDGLNRFDGKNMKNFYPDPFDSLSLSNNIIRNLLEDESGNLWVVTERGVDRYSYHGEHFRHWFSDYPELSLSEQNIKARKAPDGNIWVNASGIGLFRFSPSAGNFLPVEFGPQQEAPSRVLDFFFLNNQLLLLHDNQLACWVLKDGKIPEFSSSLALEPAEALFGESNWFVQAGNSSLLIRIPRPGVMQIIDLPTFDGYFLQTEDPSMRPTAMVAGIEGNFVWMGTDDGKIYRFYPIIRRLENVTDRLPEFHGKKVKIWSMLETSDKLLWIGTDGEGVFCSNLTPKPFFQIQRGEGSQKQLNHNIVRAIYEDKQGHLWVGTRGNGLNFLPADSRPPVYYTSANGLTNNAVLALNQDHNQNLWIGHDGPGIDVLHRKNGKFYHFPRDLKGGEHLEFGSVYAICVDVFGQLWLGTSGYGILGLDINERNGVFYLNNYMHIHNEDPADAIRSNIVYSIAEEKPNILWFATRGAGIYRLNTLTRELENFTVASGLNDNDVLSLKMSSKGILWIGSNAGLTALNTNYSPYTLENYTIRDGLPNNLVHAILEDHGGNIWLSTNKGLSMLDTRQGMFVNFNSADGLQNNEYTDGAAFRGQSSGKLYFGGINGLDWFFPADIIISGQKPRLVFTSFRLYNKTITPGDSTLLLPGNINDLEEIKLKHHQNFFTIGFTTLNFINPEKTQFQYRLVDFNSDWVFAGNSREANFTNVPAGRYILQVRATNEDAIWSDELRQIRIVILPPFRKTWPAYLLYGSLSLAGIFLFYRFQSMRIRERQKQAFEKMQQEKEKELNQYKLQFFTNLAHELGTPLTLILASSESLLNQGRKNPETPGLVKTIYHNSRRLQRLVQELLEFRKVDTGREKLLMQKTELVATIHNITEVFSHFAREHELEIIFEPRSPDIWVMTDTGKLEKIMLNLLSNAIKFTPPGGYIRVGLQYQENTISLSVCDTGIGIAPENLPYIFDSFYQTFPPNQQIFHGFKGIGIGLAYVKRLVEFLGGNIRAESIPSKGSCFFVDLPAREVEAGTANKLPGVRNLAEDIAGQLAEYKSELNRSSFQKLWNLPGKYRILVAEDEPELAALLQKLLFPRYDVIIAPDGRKAIEIMQTNRIDLVISDVVMPGMDGLTLCKTIKTDFLTSHIPVILLTARTDIENRIEGLEMGADSYIPKPFYPKHLFVRIEKLLNAREHAFEYFKTHFGTPAFYQQQDLSPRDNQLLEKCLDYIYKNYSDENAGGDQMASHLALSKAQLYRKIKALTGLTPHGLMKNYRLKKARQLLSEGKYSISDIIFMTGFNNRTYFYRSYKEVFGETPGDFFKT